MIRLLATGDGSFSLYNEQLQESYHSIHGARQESEFVFIQAGLSYLHRSKHQISILEVGLGTGLNVMLSLEYMQRFPEVQIHYTALEPYPIDQELISQYAALLPETSRDLFLKIHQIAEDEDCELIPGFQFEKHRIELNRWEGSTSYDLVYFDAFGPNVQPELWTEEALQKSISGLSDGGVWVTYCAKGEVRRSLERLGLRMERLEGPPGKRHMLRGVKHPL